MRLRKRASEKVSYFIPDPLKQNFEKTSSYFKYVMEIIDASDGIQQINLLKKLESDIFQNDAAEMEINLIIETFCMMFYQSPVKSCHRKSLQRIIQEISFKFPEIAEECLEKSVMSVINMSLINRAVEDLELPMLYIISFLNDITLGKKVINKVSFSVWKYSSSVFKVLVEEVKKDCNLQRKNHLYSICQTLLKLITHVIQSCDDLQEFLKSSNITSAIVTDYCHEIKECLQYLLTSEDTALNCRLNAAFALCYYHYFSYGAKVLKKDMLDSNYFPYPLCSRLCIYSGIMAVLPAQNFIEIMNGCIIAKKILEEMLILSKSVYDSEVILLCGRNILQWTNIMQTVFKKDLAEEDNLNIINMFSKDEIMLKTIFDYVICSLDHFIDTLRHLSKDIFRNVLHLHILSIKVEPRESNILKELTIHLLKDLPTHSRSKYGMLCCITEVVGSEVILHWHQFLIYELYNALEDTSLISHVSELFQVLFCRSVNIDEDKFHEIWLKPLLNVLHKGSKGQARAINEHILPKLLHVKSSCLHFLLVEFSSMWERNIGNGFSTFITCMKQYQKEKDSLNYLNFMPSSSLLKAFSHGDHEVRLSAFSLLCESSKTTEPVHLDYLEIIKYSLPYNINCQSPSFRQQFIAYMKKLFVRMIESSYSMMKNQKQDNKSSPLGLPEIYQDFLLWLRKFLFECLYPGANFPRRVASLNLLYLLHEIFSEKFLIVDSKITIETLLFALQDTYENNKVLTLQLLSSEYALSVDMKDEILFKAVLTLSSSTKPPDTVTSAYLLKFLVKRSSFQPVAHNYLMLLTSQGFSLPNLQQIPSDLWCASYFTALSMLILELNKQLQFAKQSLLEAAVHAPLYGVLTCIRYVMRDVKFFNIDQQSLQQWQNLISELIDLCIIVAHIVEPVVCNLSPEGHLPMDTSTDSISQLQSAVKRALGCRFQSAVLKDYSLFESNAGALDIVKTHAVTAQILLLCCWRTHKEVSLLLGDISENIALFNNKLIELLNVSQIKNIGKFFIHQMSLVKHKGAFEQAYIGFSKLCSQLWRCNLSELYELPKIWLNDLILAIKGQKKDMQLCPTRRSAGLPFIIQGLLISEPSVASSSFFKESIATFLFLAQPTENHSPDAQIHALNILRALFRDSSLGEAVMPFVSIGLEISIIGFKSNLWAVRNSSTLLFSALMTRVFGVSRSQDEIGKKNRQTGKSFFSLYKNLYNFLYKELKQCADALHIHKINHISIQPSLYPILLLLGHLYPAPGEKDSHLSSFVPLLQVCASSPVWKIRVLSAKALVSFRIYESISSAVQSIVEKLSCNKSILSQNAVHGLLLEIVYFLSEIQNLSDSHKSLVKNVLYSWIISSYDVYLSNNKCLSTKTAYLEILLSIMSINVKPDILPNAEIIQNLLKDLQSNISCPDKDSYFALAEAVIFMYTLHLEEHTCSGVQEAAAELSLIELALEFLTNPHTIIRSFCIEFLLWIFQDENYNAHKCYVNSSDDIIIERVFRILNLDKRKPICKDIFFEEPKLCDCTINLLKKEKDPSFLRQIYFLLRLMPSSKISPWQFLSGSQTGDLPNKLKFILAEMEDCTGDETSCEMMLYSAQIFIAMCQDFEKNELLKNSSKDYCDIIEKWLENLEETAYPHNTVLQRQTVVSVLQMLLNESLLLNSELIGSKSHYLWHSLLLVLIDDEPEIKELAAQVVTNIKSARNEGFTSISVVPTKALDLMIGIYTEASHDFPNICVSMLINWMLMSSIDYLDSVSDEQPFDKGEMNVFSEDLNLTQITSKHLSSFLQHLATQDIAVSVHRISCWKDKSPVETTYTLNQVITLCLSEAISLIDCFFVRSAISPVLDAYFSNELLQISQRLSVILVVLPWIQTQPDLKILGQKLLEKFQNLDFRTVFIKEIITKISLFLSELCK